MLLDGHALTSASSRKPDEELVKDWRTGAYPYKNLMSRKRYESQKYQLQVELLKHTERGQWYFQRYVQHLPTAGEIVMFERQLVSSGAASRNASCTP